MQTLLKLEMFHFKFQFISFLNFIPNFILKFI